MRIPYGQWPSPITAEGVSHCANSLNYIEIDGSNTYWIEGRPQEKGRFTLMCANSGACQDVTSQYDLRSRVHEYGGKPYTVRDGVIYFVNFSDQALYIQREGRAVPLTDGSLRIVEPLATGQGIIAVAEEHRQTVSNFLAWIDIATGATAILASGQDFYAAPAISPDGNKLAWISWNHPNMPWDGTQLWVADFGEGQISQPQCIAGGCDESILQPQWSPQGILHYISDRSGWWNLYRQDENLSLCPMEAEFGLPPWYSGMCTYGFDGDAVIASFQKEGRWKLVRIPKTGPVEDLQFPAAMISSVCVQQGVAAFVSGFATDHTKVMRMDLSSQKAVQIDSSSINVINPDYCSIGEPISFPSLRGHHAHAYYYPPKNTNCHSPQNTLPPLLVKVHGGPTAQSKNCYNKGIQFWTSRGFAVVDVNYAGSSGYGRSYRDLLKKQWGKIDWEDCEAAALSLIKDGLADPAKIFIEGSSAGGYTVLCALTFGTLFAAGASHYGISDLSLLAAETHKFESRYMDQLIGPYPASKALFDERSPLKQAHLLNCPVIFFQGEEDHVVPPNQAKKLYDVLKQKGLQTELFLYPGEYHGFKRAETIQDTLEKQLAFFLSF